jgi:hypothetical protein
LRILRLIGDPAGHSKNGLVDHSAFVIDIGTTPARSAGSTRRAARSLSALDSATQIFGTPVSGVDAHSSSRRKCSTGGAVTTCSAPCGVFPSGSMCAWHACDGLRWEPRLINPAVAHYALRNG